mgnify:CR=1 FL=1
MPNSHQISAILSCLEGRISFLICVEIPLLRFDGTSAIELKLRMLQPSPIILQTVRYPYLSSWSYRLSSRDSWRFYWNDRDCARVLLEGESSWRRLRANCFYLIPRQTSYATETEAPFLHFYLHFHFSWPHPPGVFEFPLEPGMLRLIEHIREVAGDHEDNNEKNYLAYTLAYRAMEHLPIRGVASNSYERQLLPAFNFLHQDLRETPTNDVLAQMAGLSVNAFIRHFREIYGTTPRQYLMVRRCETAARLLDSGELSLEQIAERTGFCDRFHLTRTFTRMRGISPAAYRRARQAR